MKPLLFLLCVAICFFTTAVIAQTTDTTQQSAPLDQEVTAFGGPSIPYLPQDFHDIWKKGWNAGVGYGISFAPGSIGYGAVYATVAFDRFAVDVPSYRNWWLGQTGLSRTDQSTIQNAPLSARGAVKSVTAMLNFKGSFSSTKQSIAPYFLLGVGYIHYAVDSVSLVGASQFSVGGQSESAFAWTFGVGVEVPVFTSFAIFAEARSVIGVVSNTRQYFPVSGGIRYRFQR